MNARDAKIHLAELLRCERHAMADFILALADFDEKKLWRDLEYASLFSFLRAGLGLSAGAAQYRKTAAELVKRYPEVEESLRQGKLCLSSAIELAKVLTPENVSEVLPRFFGLSSRDAAAVAVSIRPVDDPPVRERVTNLRSTAPAQLATVPTGTASCAPAARSFAAVPSSAESPNELPLDNRVRAPEVPASDTMSAFLAPATPTRAANEPRPSVEPLDAERARLHITVSRRFLAKLEAAKAALSHSHPGASSEEVLEAALDLLLAERAKRKGIVEKPRTTSTAPARSETIPAAVKREVWTRAGGRCEWKLESGRTCDSTLRLEFDHILPRAMGGPSTVENVRLTCRGHNLLAARQAFGDAWMDRFTRATRRAGSNAARPRGAPLHSRGVLPATAEGCDES